MKNTKNFTNRAYRRAVIRSAPSTDAPLDGIAARAKGESLEPSSAYDRNAPCPCGSGAKAKKCCEGVA